MAFSAKSSNFAQTKRTTTPIYIYASMKIINSHYIPLPEPRWLIMDPKGSIYEQVGTLTVVADASKNKGEGGIVTYAHPVVAHTAVDTSEEKGDTIQFYSMLTPANGQVLDDVLLDDCTPLCLSQYRSLNYLRFNALYFKLTDTHYEDFYLEDFIEDLKYYAIKLIFPKKELHEIHITTYSNQEHTERGSFLINDLTEILFMVPFWAYADKKGVHIKWDEIFMEYVNQARAYLKINPNYRFHFSSSLEILEPLVERLNNELNDYLERKEEK